jgi:hypothetical protein
MCIICKMNKQFPELGDYLVGEFASLDERVKLKFPNLRLADFCMVGVAVFANAAGSVMGIEGREVLQKMATPEGSKELESLN